jgi:hypothetical protein
MITIKGVFTKCLAPFFFQSKPSNEMKLAIYIRYYQFVAMENLDSAKKCFC